VTLGGERQHEQRAFRHSDTGEGQAGELPHQRFSLSTPEEDDQDSGPSRPRVRYEPGVGLGLEYPAFSVQDPELEVPERSFEDLLMGVGNGF
jgi:hypothetical protein